MSADAVFYFSLLMKRMMLFGGFLVLFCCAALAERHTLDLSAVLDLYSQTGEGFWTETYTNETYVSQGIFRFSHTGSSDAGMGMAYWDGFTLCTNSETYDYGNGGSDGWIEHQWGCMAGGGLNEEGEAEYGVPYLVAYWGFALEQTDNMYHSLQVDFTDNQAYNPEGVYICNHPWPYYGNIHGDGFAEGFRTEGDRFTVVAHGLNQYGEPTGTTAELVLAEFTDGELHQSDQWEYFDLTALGTVSGIYFTMTTTDASAQFGANTAVYFCLCRLSVSAPQDEQPTGLADYTAQSHTLPMVYSVDGRPLGTTVPQSRGVYIIRQGDQSRKRINL